MRSPAFVAALLLLLATSASAQGYDLTIHLSTGETVTFSHDEIRRIEFVNGTSGINDPDGPGAVPTAFQVLRNYPNPFNPSTTIVYEMPAAAPVAVRIYDLHGALVRELLNETQSAGRHEATWNGTDDSSAHVASGVYFCAVTCGGEVQSRQMILVK